MYYEDSKKHEGLNCDLDLLCYFVVSFKLILDIVSSVEGGSRQIGN